MAVLRWVQDTEVYGDWLVVWNIPIACNRASADFMISSPLMEGEYNRFVPDYEEYRTRKIDWGSQPTEYLA
jgi:hypothetical protein